MTFLAFRPFRPSREHRRHTLKSKDNTKQTLHAKFYASRVKNKRVRGVKYAPPGSKV